MSRVNFDREFRRFENRQQRRTFVRRYSSGEYVEYEK